MSNKGHPITGHTLSGKLFKLLKIKQKGVETMSKYSKEITISICNLIKSDSYTISEICRLSGITPETFCQWRNKKPEFAEAIKMAEQKRLDFFAVEAKKSLLKMIQGYTIQEKRTVMVDSGIKDEGQMTIPIIKEKVITEKYFPPDITAIIFALCNLDPDNWKDRLNMELTRGSGSNPTMILPNGTEIEL